jgi:AcrR family transcriptional regulator
MRTKKEIKAVSRQLFNVLGVMNVTLRDVAQAMQKSYGNITYHFPTKEVLILQLFNDMHQTLASLQKPPDPANLLTYFLELPGISYDITLCYLFFTVDYTELKRHYPEICRRINVLNEERKQKWQTLMKVLRAEHYLQAALTDSELDYIMLLSASVRSAYFQVEAPEAYHKPAYVTMVNQLLKPYLSSRGLDVFHDWQAKATENIAGTTMG